MTEWWRGSVTYQVYPRSFQDTNGDGIGDLPGIIRRLGHIAALGCDCVWLSPIFTSPMKDMGYDVSGYMGVEPSFGTLADFDALVTRAHELGLKVIIDQVLNHCSDQHPFFQESRQSRTNSKADWFLWVDPRPDGTPPNNWLSVFGGPAWAWDARRKQYYMHSFLVEQPELNFRNPDVMAYMESVLRFWLDRGVDGFRFDTVNYFFKDALLRHDAADYRVKAEPDGNPYDMQFHLFSKNQPENLGWLQRVRTVLDDYKDTTSVGEVGEAHTAIKLMGEYTQAGRLHQCYSFEMLGPDFSPAFFRANVEEFFKGAPNGWPMWAFSNHDVQRHVTRWAKHGISPEALAKQSAALPVAGRGVGPDRHRTGAGRADRPPRHHLLARAHRPRQHPHADGLGRLAAGRLHHRQALASGQSAATGPQRGLAGWQAGFGAGILPRGAGVPQSQRRAALGQHAVSGCAGPDPCLHASGTGRDAVLRVQPVAPAHQPDRIGPGCRDRPGPGGQPQRQNAITGPERRGFPDRRRRRGARLVAVRRVRSNLSTSLISHGI